MLNYIDIFMGMWFDLKPQPSRNHIFFFCLGSLSKKAGIHVSVYERQVFFPLSVCSEDKSDVTERANKKSPRTDVYGTAPLGNLLSSFRKASSLVLLPLASTQKLYNRSLEYKKKRLFFRFSVSTHESMFRTVHSSFLRNIIPQSGRFHHLLCV